MMLTIADFRDSSDWKWDSLSFVLTPLIKEKIRAIPLQEYGSEEDVLLWKFTKDGDFSSNSAYLSLLDEPEALEVEFDNELEDIMEGLVEVKLSKETKNRIKAPWAKALIVKVFGRTVGYNYLTFKINAMWKPIARMDCVDLGKDFFLIKFYENGDYDKVLRGGPWFVGEHFLAIKPWEPYFKASESSFSSVAVWVRFPELPIEFYDRSVLLEIGRAIGPVLRIDSYIASSSRGSYARLCIQIDLMKPLVNTIKVGQLYQKVMYEGLSTLCFCYGRVGHKQEACCFHVQTEEKASLDVLARWGSNMAEVFAVFDRPPSLDVMYLLNMDSVGMYVNRLSELDPNSTPWEPYFKASESSFSSVAVWVRFPELPIEFYDRSVLLEIGRAIGPVLRIDSYIASSSRGSYARLCIQIDLMKPLVNTIKVGQLYQKVMYEDKTFLFKARSSRDSVLADDIRRKTREENVHNMPKDGVEIQEGCIGNDGLLLENEMGCHLSQVNGTEKEKAKSIRSPKEHSMDHLNRRPSTPPFLGWAIWHRNKAVVIPDEVIAQICSAPMVTMGGTEESLCTTWKHIFPITPESMRTRNLALDHPAWGITPNPWWNFLTDMPLISEVEAEELNKLRRPFVLPHLDESGWLIQERKVIDFRGATSAHLGNFPTLKLFQVLKTVRNYDLLVYCKEEVKEILNYLTVWKPDWAASKDLLRRMGWSMIATSMMGTNPIEIPNKHCSQMNVLVWNCRGALNSDFKKRVFEMAVNHFPSVMIITETRIEGDRAAKICEDLPFDGFFVTDTIGYAGGLWLLWKKEEVDIFVLSSTEQEIHATVKVSDLILECIDRGFANPSCRILYPEASITHLPRVFSDHCPVLLELSKAPPASINRPFRFQTMWLHHPGFPNVVREAWEQESILPSAIKLFTNKATLWNKTVFGNLFARKRRLLARINGTQKALSNGPNQFLVQLEQGLIKEYSIIRLQEEEYWALKSPINWAAYGDPALMLQLSIKQQFRPIEEKTTHNYTLPMKSGMRRPLEALPVGYLKKLSP
nr:hypothetical protein CFP56_49691 [Quercus suber]